MPFRVLTHSCEFRDLDVPRLVDSATPWQETLRALRAILEEVSLLSYSFVRGLILGSRLERRVLAVRTLGIADSRRR